MTWRRNGPYSSFLFHCYSHPGLLPPDLFSRIIDASNHDPKKLAEHLAQLFTAMASGGTFGLDNIRHFNGNLFEDAAVIFPTPGEMGSIKEAARLDWSQVDPSIFGTLFVRGMDPGLRSQLGAHYTSYQDIETLVEPVVMAPLRREWAEVRQEVERSLGLAPESGPAKKSAKKPKKSKKPDSLIRDFLQRLQSVTVLDPACGSGNFLYVSLQKLKDLEQEILIYFEDHGFGKLLPFVGPRQLLGLEINAYAFDLAQMTVWIGYLQWQRSNGYRTFGEPILQRLDTFRCMDSVLDLTDPSNPKESEWPEAEFIVGNPPFVGGNRIRRELGDDYVDKLFRLYKAQVPSSSDLCCYWFEKARRQLNLGKCERVGLLATQAIRGGANRTVLDNIKVDGDIFFAYSDRDWILDGASVHVSMIAFDKGQEPFKALDGLAVPTINSDLTSTSDLTLSKRLEGQSAIWCYGSQQKAKFDINYQLGLQFLASPNPSGRPNSDVIRPSVNGAQVLRETHESFVIDYGMLRDIDQASLYEQPFEYIKANIFPSRKDHREAIQKNFWWLHARPSPVYRRAITNLKRCLITTSASKHRVFLWIYPPILLDHQLIVFARDDDYFLGTLHSKLHELWSRARGTQVRERESGFRYTPKTCFETFPFPEPTEAQRAAIGDAARDLDALRSRWLNPPEWTRQEILEFPGSVEGPWSRFVHNPDDRGIGTVRYLVIKPGSSSITKNLAERTLTNLYNKPPAWLESAHRKLDAAVFAAYGWESNLTDDEILSRLLALNLERAKASGPTPLDIDEADDQASGGD
jgi:hypothetical protein